MPRGGARAGAGRRVDPNSARQVKLRSKNGVASPSPGKAAAQAKEQSRPLISADAAQMIISAWQERAQRATARARTEEWNPYIVRPEKFGPVYEHVKRHRPSLAMDWKRNPNALALDNANQVAIQAWQAGGLIGNAVAEGLLFLGYPYLSELSQRPEFRLFGEIRAQEMTRKWIRLRGTNDESTKEDKPDQQRNERDDARDRSGEPPRSESRNKDIEDKIKELDDFLEEIKVRAWFQDAAAQDSFFGLSHLYLDLKGVDLNNLQDPELKTDIGNGSDAASKAKLGKNCLRGLRTIEPIWVYPTTYNAVNPLLPSWYDPQVWYVMGTEIHKSRLLSFMGRPVPDILKPAYAFGGLAMTQMAQPYVDIWLRTRESVGEIIHAFSVMILMTNMATTTQPGGAGGGGGDILARMAIADMLRDNQGMMVIDKATEDFKNISAPLGGLDELQAQAQEHMFSVGRIPAVKFAGIQPKGLNATSEGEMRAFYDTIIGEQNHLFRPNLTSVIDIAQISLWGACDKDITYDFVPLWELTEKEKSEKRKVDAETAQIHIDTGTISQEEERTRIANDPESGYAFIDPDEMPELLEEEETGLIPEGAGRGIEAELEEAEGQPGGTKSNSKRPTPQRGAPPARDDHSSEGQLKRERVVTAGGDPDAEDQEASLETREGKPTGLED